MKTLIQSLVEKAKSHREYRSCHGFSPDEVDLALAWSRGEITEGQVIAAMNSHSPGGLVYIFLARALRQHAIDVEMS